MATQQKHLGSDPEDIEDVLKLIEQSFDIRLETNELQNVQTFGQLTDFIKSKIRLEDRRDCTEQQAFYKLRTALQATKQINRSTISPETMLAAIIPKRSRRKDIKELEKQLGFKLKALRPRFAVTNSLAIVLLVSFFLLFVKWQLGATGLLVSIGGLWLAENLGNEFKDTTFRQLTDRMTQLNYTKSRREPGTMNGDEIAAKIEKVFIEHLGLEMGSIDRETVII